MSQRIIRSIREPIRKDLTWDERWRGEDHGLITSWEVGRALREKDPDLARRAEDGELPVLGWKGGVEKKLKIGLKYGTLNYLAEWQGLRGEDLDIDPTQEVTLFCSRTGMKVVYTPEASKYGNE
jgi:hypothetical protein